MSGESLWPSPGQRVGGRYRVESLLGRGAIGVVLEATDETSGRSVAIKLLLPDSATSAEVVARFIAEARLTSKIEHPNVVEVLDVGREGDRLFLVMERLRGESLRERLERGRIPWREAVSIVAAVCRGVAEAHGEGVIHRDLKPDNIFLCRGKDGAPRPPKVLDFGVGKLRDSERASITKSGSVIGTPLYMSPEQLGSPRDADHRADVYSMGVVLYEALTGQLPYQADNLYVLAAQLATAKPRPVRTIAADVPEVLEALVQRAMSVDPGARHASMRELAAELEALEGTADPHADARGSHRPKAGAPRVVVRAAERAEGLATRDVALAATPPDLRPRTPVVPPRVERAPAVLPEAPRAPRAAARPKASGPPVRGLLVAVGTALVGTVLAACVLLAAAAHYARPRADHPVALPSGEPRAPEVGLSFAGACSETRFEEPLLVYVVEDDGVSITRPAGGYVMVHFAPMEVADGDEPVTLNLDAAAPGDAPEVILYFFELWSSRNVHPAESSRGTIEVRQLDLARASMDVTFHHVRLGEPVRHQVCTIEGRLRTFGPRMEH